jgi:hypothetical protein
MNVEIGTVPAQFLSWQYLFRIFGIVSLQCSVKEDDLFAVVLLDTINNFLYRGVGPEIFIPPSRHISSPIPPPFPPSIKKLFVMLLLNSMAHYWYRLKLEDMLSLSSLKTLYKTPSNFYCAFY